MEEDTPNHNLSNLCLDRIPGFFRLSTAYLPNNLFYLQTVDRIQEERIFIFHLKLTNKLMVYSLQT
jgi:hypothetical protein